MKRLSATLAVAATVALGLAAVPADAQVRHRNHVHITTGSFETLPGGQGLGYEITGRAVMIRVGHAHGERFGPPGRTVVLVRANGLDPDTTYPAHVHDQPCSATPPGGSHYQHVVGGPVDDVNEIWPAITTNRAGRGTGFATHDARTRDDARSIVVHYPPDTSVRLACLDLS